MLLLLIPIVIGLEECPRFAYPKDIPCVIKSTWDADCLGNFTFYNESGSLVYNTLWENSKPYCQAVYNYSNIGTFCGNSTIEDSCITIQGENDKMIMAITLFLLGINIFTFALPFWVNFSESEAANYVVKRMFWVGSLILLWFNTTLFRQLASDWGLGIDNFLIAYWWIFTFGIFASVLIICYIMVVGAMKLMKEAKLRERMGEYDY